MSYNHVDINIMGFKVYTTTYLLLFFIFFFPKAVFPQVGQGSLDALSEERPIVEADKYVLEAEKNIQNNNLSLALSNYDKAIEVFPQYAQIYIKRGIVKIQLGKYEDAINDFTLAISIEPKREYDNGSLMHKIHSQKNAEAFFYRGQVRNILDDYENALNDYTESLKFNDVYNTNLSEGNIENKKFPNTERIHEVYRNIQQKISRDEIIHNFSRYKYDRKSAKQVINDHFIELSMQNLSSFPNPVKLIRQNPQTYSEFLEPKDIILYDENLSLKIDSLFNNNESFQRLLIQNQIQEFESELSTKSTGSVFDSQINPTNYAKAYAIYIRFGREALTDYTNILQHYDPDGLRPQNNSVISAIRRFNSSPQYERVNIFQYAEDRLRFD